MQTYPAKLLLFGEYILLCGARALSYPLLPFYAHWHKTGNPNPDSDLLEFACSEALKQVPNLNTSAFEADIRAGWVLQSNIPRGYGLGSSGAVCAAVFDKYSTAQSADIGQLKRIFAQMESWFHGNSSGIDPLTSWLQKPLLVMRKTEVAIAATAMPADIQVFLVDTGLQRQAGALIKWFVQSLESPEYRHQLDHHVIPAHESMLDGWLAQQGDQFWSGLTAFSALQLANFRPMIPAAMLPLWEAGIAGDTFRLKLCGAGGGGFMLGFSRDADTVKQLARQYQIIFPMQSTL